MAVFTPMQATRATIEKDGAAKNVAAVELSAADARVLGAYQSWLSARQLSRDLYCSACGPDIELEVFVEPDRIALICDHRWLHYTGPVAMRLSTRPIGEEPSNLILIAVPDEPIASDDALMLREYKKLLERFALQEALWCDVCDQVGRHNGCRGEVTDTSIEVVCRCRRRVQRGLVT